jgi:hypothetical protein
MPARKRQMRRTDVTTKEGKIMKTRTTSSILIAILLAFLTLGVSETQAIVIVGGRPVGITSGQTARVTAANTGTRAIIISGTFLDSGGTVLAQFDSQVIEPGKMMSFDLNADDIVRENNRIQIRVVLSGDRLRGLLASTEVFENDTGKTTVFLGGPDT